MVTDKERQEVAARLRALPTNTCAAVKEWEKEGLFIGESPSDEADYSQIHDAVTGCFPSEPMDMTDYKELHERLAYLIEPTPIDGETSDGYHTFNELYHHRAVLFSVIVAMFSDRAWKSKRHADGTMYDGMFIVGIDTPDGQATYHYDLGPYWDMFRCKEVDYAPEWDGHTPEQAIERIGKLAGLVGRTCRIESVEPIEYGEYNETIGYWFNLSCGHYIEKQYDDMVPKFCDECGAKVVNDDR